MVRAGNHSRPDPFRNPYSIYKISDFRAYFEELSGLYAQTGGIERVQPERIFVRDFVEPFGVP